MKKHGDYFLNIFIGGRGTGKTYSALKGVILKGSPFMYVRRTETELANCCNKAYNPFKTLNTDMERNIELVSNADSYIIKENDDNIGVAAALSTFGKFRSADFNEIDYIIFDEFINTNPRQTVKNEADLFFNLLETVGRNRELQGKKPLKIILLSNSNTINTDILATLKLAEVIRIMKEKGDEIYIDKDRGILISILKSAKFKEQKSKTALYKLTKGTKYNEMALENEFTDMVIEDVKKVDYRRLLPLVAINDIYIYDIKNSDKIYVTYRKADVYVYDNSNLKKFKAVYGSYIQNKFYNKKILYSDYDIKNGLFNTLEIKIKT